MLVRWTDGLKAGETAEIDDYVGLAHLASGKAVRVEEEVAESEIAETPETPKRRGRHAAAKAETR